MRPRVLRIITRLNVGGPATHVRILEEGLGALGWETLLVHGDVEPSEAEIPLDDLAVPRRRISTLARPIRPVPDLESLAAILGVIRSYRPHVIHTHLSKAGLLGRSAAMMTSHAVRIHTFHGTLFGDYFGARATSSIVRAERWLGHHSDRIVALSELQRRELLDHRIAPGDRIRIIPLGLDLERFRHGDRGASRARLGVGEDELLIVAVGRLVPVKRLDRLIDAFATVGDALPSARLALVGDGTEAEALRRRVRDVGVADFVRFAGWSSDTPDWYAAADVVAMTSDREGTPLSLIEAAAAGRPVVATEAGGVADIVQDGRTGFVVARSDDVGLQDRLRRLATDPTLRAEMGSRAEMMAVRFDRTRLVRDIDELYRGALRERRARRAD